LAFLQKINISIADLVFKKKLRFRFSLIAKFSYLTTRVESFKKIKKNAANPIKTSNTNILNNGN